MRFIDGCLHWDPDMRMTPAQALAHNLFITGSPATKSPKRSLSAKTQENERSSAQKETDEVEERIKQMFEEGGRSLSAQSIN